MDSGSLQSVRGRDPELAVLGQQLDELLSGVGSIVIVEGRGGMGKSRLLIEMAGMAERLSVRVGIGEADPGDTVVQLSVLMDALFEGPSPILERSALGDTHASPEQRYWLLQDLEALLERTALKGPLLICLDDVQWADNGTAAALRSLPRRLATVPIGWVIAVRPGMESPQVRSALDFITDRGAARIVLGPLDMAGVAQMAADAFGADPDRELLKMAERSSGSPFLLVELLSGLREEGLVSVESGQARLVQWRLPDRVSQSMRLRLERMSELTHQVATVAAALGRRFSLDGLAAMVNRSPSELVSAVEELICADLLVEADGRLMFGHDLLLEAVRASVPVSVRQSLDRQAASVLLAQGALPAEVAVQMAESASPGDETAITTLLKAAEMVGPTDPSAAADLGLQALDLCPTRHPLRGPLVAGTALWLHAAGRGSEAETFADTALHEAFPSDQEAQIRLSVAGMFVLSPEVRADEGRHALALPALPATLRAHHLALLFHNLVTAGRVEEARVMLDEVKSAVDSRDDVAARFAFELASSGLMYADGDFSSALSTVEAALRSGIRTSDGTRVHLTYQWRCEVLTMVDRLDESLEMLATGVAAAQRDRQSWALSVFETGRGRQLLQMGRVADAAVVLEGQLPADMADRFVSVLDAAGVVALGRAAIHLGDRTLSRQARAIAQVMLGERALSVRHHAVWLLALQDMAAGDAASAHQWLGSLGEHDRTEILPLFPMDITDDARLIHIALAVHDDELAAHAAYSSECRAQRNPQVRSLVAAARHARGLVHRNREDLAEAVMLYGGGPRPLAFAAAAEDLGVLAVERGDTNDAISVFSHSLEAYAHAGAVWDVGRLRGRLRALGVRRRLVEERRPGQGWSSLTESELTVAQLVAQGLTNREIAEQLFITHHTVSGHMRNLFTKLDVNSRVELTRLALLQDPPP